MLYHAGPRSLVFFAECLKMITDSSPLDQRPVHRLVQDCLEDCFKSRSRLPYVDNGKLQLPASTSASGFSCLGNVATYLHLRKKPPEISPVKDGLYSFFCFVLFFDAFDFERKGKKASQSYCE